MLINTKALVLKLFSNSFSDIVKTLIDLGLSNLFIGPFFVLSHKLLTHSISPLSLFLIDSTVSNFVKEIVTLLIKLVCSLLFELNLFITLLTKDYPIVLGHSWLKLANPIDNWAILNLS